MVARTAAIMPGDRPTFSILVPCYQRANLLPAALDSALAQEPDGVEIIVINDGSTDETHEVASRYVARHPERVRLVEQDNRGVTLARAAGFEIATGEYLVFLDSDDLLEPGMISACRRALARRPDAALLVGNAWAIVGDRRERLPMDQAASIGWPAVLERNPFGYTVAVVPRVDAVRGVGGLACQGFPTCEDFDLWVRLVRARMPVLTIPERLGSRRMTPGSLSRDPLLLLDGRHHVLDTAVAPDPRLAALGEAVEAPIDRARWARLRNGAVFNALGLALASDHDPVTVDVILGRLTAGAYDATYCTDEFRLGAQHALFLRSGPRRTRAVPRAAIDAALARHAFPPLTARMARRLHRALNPHRDPAALWGTAQWRVERLARRILSGLT
jgi:hypothetical protein